MLIIDGCGPLHTHVVSVSNQRRRSWLTSLRLAHGNTAPNGICCTRQQPQSEPRRMTSFILHDDNLLPQQSPGDACDEGPMVHSSRARRATDQLSQQKSPFHVIDGVAYPSNGFDIDCVIAFLVNARTCTVLVATCHDELGREDRDIGV